MKDNLIKLIILEDDKDWATMYKDSIDDYNNETKNDEYKFEYNIAENMLEFYELMFCNEFDVLIADINIAQKMDGNIAIKKAIEKLRIPVFVVSGDLSKLDFDEKESYIYKTCQRDDVDVEKLLTDISDMFSKNDFNYLKLGGKIDNKINEIYRNSVKDNDLLKSFGNQKNRLVRYITSRITDELKLSNELKHDNYLTAEVVIIPGIGKLLYSGDIIVYNEADYVIMNPPCDIEQNKADYYLLCKIVDEPIKKSHGEEWQ